MNKTFDPVADRRYTIAVVALIILLAAVRILYIRFGPLILSPDETYFWDWSRHCDLSYFDQGPMVADEELAG